MSEDSRVTREGGPSKAAFERAGEVLYRALERLAIEDAERAQEEKR